MGLRLTGEAGRLVARSVGEARRLVTRLRQRARGRGAQAKLAAAQRLEELTDRADKVVAQVTKRVAGHKITDRLVSMSDPDARPIRKGKLRQPTEFGSVFQICEITENTRRGARGLIVPAASQIGSPNEPDLLPATARELDGLGTAPREVALDGGFARRTDRRLARYRVGAEGRISHLKRRYGRRRSRLKGHAGARTWAAWSILAYNLDTLAIRST